MPAETGALRCDPDTDFSFTETGKWLDESEKMVAKATFLLPEWRVGVRRPVLPRGEVEHNRMSALPPKADIRARHRHVCFGPKGDITGLLNHLARLCNKIWWHD